MNSNTLSGYDPERYPPYSYEVYFERNGNLYKTICYVCKGYGDSVSISCGSSSIVSKEEQNEKSNYEQPKH